MRPYKVVVVEDDKYCADTVKEILENDSEIEVVGVAYTGETLLANIDEWMPDVVLMDLHLSEDVTGVYYIRKLRDINPQVGILVWTNYRIDHPQVLAAIRAGINGYIIKGPGYLQLWERVKAAARDREWIDTEVSKVLLKGLREEQDWLTLTKRELEVLACLTEGLSNNEIAKNLAVQEDTVKKHVSNILSKLRMQDRTQAALYAYKKGLTR